MSAGPGKIWHAIVAAAAARGVEPARLLAAAGVDPEPLADPQYELPISLQQRLWHEAPRLSGDDAFGLHLASLLQPADFGGLGFAVRSSSTLGAAYARVARYLRLVHREAEVAVAVVGDRAHVRHVSPASRPTPRHGAEFLIAVMAQIGRNEVGPGFRPLEARFRHTAPTGTEEHVRVFSCPVRFEQPHDELVLAREALELPFSRAEPALCEVLDRHLQELVARLPTSRTFLDDARAGLVAELRDGEPTVERLARRLRTSARSLQRRLQQEGSSLQALLAEVRSGLAIRYLTEERESIAEVAFLLGFSDVSTFHRAFKRWTGVTPAAYRRRRVETGAA